MQKKFKQIIYCHPNSSINTTGITRDSLVTGSAFTDYFPLSQLGVRALPGTKFYVNGTDNPVIIGFTGMFELDLSRGGSISSLAFDEQSLLEIERNDSAYLVIDMLGLGGN